MHPGIVAATRPDSVAAVAATSGRMVTYGELEASSNQLAHLFRSRGLSAGTHLAVFLDNCLRYFEVAWGALRAGLYITPINWHLGTEEAGYIIRDCDAQALVSTAKFAEVLQGLWPSLVDVSSRI